MNLKILLPFKIFTEEMDVTQVVLETTEGSVGLLPHRLDCVAALIPGILEYKTAGKSIYVAVDEGVMAKTGPDVLVSVRHAIGGADLAQLHEAVKREFLNIDEREREVRAAEARMEGTLVRRVAEFQHGR
jgi:F-type H+-transporting ATPase subunit epsilon